jgi:PTH1 family peptidyl-tRNA hydrolase
MNLVVGLGNTGQQYARTRHNVGLMALEKLGQKLALNWKPKISLGGHTASDNNKILLYWPETFMNICGKNVKLVIGKHKIDKNKLIVIHDCLETKLGAVKL